MFNKEKNYIFILLHSVYLICLVWLSFNYLGNIKDVFYNIWFPIILYFIGTITFILTYNNKSTINFYILLTIIGIILSASNTLIGYFSLSIFPLVLYLFVAYFLHLDKSRLFIVFRNILIVSFLLLFFMYTHEAIFPTVAWALVITIFLVLTFLLYLNFQIEKKNKFKYSKLLLIGIFIYIFPFICSVFLHSLNILSMYDYLSTFYTFIALPLVVAYILLEENSMIVYYTKKELLLMFLLMIASLSITILIFIKVLDLEETKIAIVIMTFIEIIYIFVMVAQSFSKNKIDNINENLYNNRKTEFLYQYKFQEVKNNYIELGLEKLKQEGYRNNFLLVEDKDNIAIFISGVTLDVKELKLGFRQILNYDKKFYSIAGVEYLINVFPDKKGVIGVLIEKEDKLNLEKIYNDLSQISLLLENIFDLSELKQSYKSLPGINPQDFVTEKYHYEINKVQQEESQYLHDVVLQKMVDVKNFLEVIDTSDIEFKDYVINEVSLLNASIIEHIYDLFPFTLKNLSLYECMSELITRIKQTSYFKSNKVNIELQMKRELKVKRFLFYPIYSFIKELTLNILMFAHAKNILISLEVHQNELIIKIMDDGNRINMRDIIEEQYDRKKGVFFVNYEVKELGGTMFIEKNYLKGSIVSIKLPI